MVGVRIKETALSAGDRIAFELPVDFEEQAIESLQVENQQVERAQLSMLAGIKTQLTKKHLPKGTRVFRVISEVEKN